LRNKDMKGALRRVLCRSKISFYLWQEHLELLNYPIHSLYWCWYLNIILHLFFANIKLSVQVK
jgi:hypothetical protein